MKKILLLSLLLLANNVFCQTTNKPPVINPGASTSTNGSPGVVGPGNTTQGGGQVPGFYYALVNVSNGVLYAGPYGTNFAKIGGSTVITGAQLTGGPFSIDITGRSQGTSNDLRSAITSDTSLLYSYSRQGSVGSNDYAMLRTSSGQQSMMRIPPLIIAGGNAWNASETNALTTAPCLTNLVNKFKTLGWYDIWNRYGKPWIYFEQTWATNADASGNIQLDPTLFPSGFANFGLCHSNGYKVLMWYEKGWKNGATTWSTDTNAANIYRTFAYLTTNRNALVDGFWMDMNTAYDSHAALAALNTYAAGTYLDGGFNDFTTNNYGQFALPQALSGPWATARQWQLYTTLRINVHGDPQYFTNEMVYWDEIQTNAWWKLVQPGHFLNLNEPGYWGNWSLAEEESTFIHMAMMSAPLYMAAWAPELGISKYYILTNSTYLNILEDAAVIGAERRWQTNLCDVYVKPLGGLVTSNYAISVFNRTNQSISVSVNFNALNLPNTNCSVLEVVSNLTLATSAAAFTTRALTNHESQLFLIGPGYSTASVVVTNYLQPFSYGNTLPAVVVSNGVTYVFNLPWDVDATNFIARAQLTNDPAQCYAVQFLFTRLKAQGIWTNRLDLLYPMVPWRPYLNAFSTNYTLGPVGTVTSNSLGIAGDGGASYFTNGFNLSTATRQFKTNSCSIGIYCETASPADGKILCGATTGDPVSIYIQRSAANLAPVFFSGTSFGFGGLSDYRGLLGASRIDAATGASFANHTVSGTISSTLQSGSLPNQNIFFGAYNNNGSAGFFSDAQMSGGWLGGGLSITEAATMVSIWDEYEAILGRKAP